jgi:hypothetical protein
LKPIFLLLLCVFPLQLLAQQEDQQEHEGPVKHRLSFGLGHTRVPSGELLDSDKKLAFASWTLDYDYHFNERWGIGLETDLILESFVIVRPNEEELEREYPFSITPVAQFKPAERWTFLAGLGAEFAPGETLAYTRLGVEYGIEISDKWEVGATLLWDARWDYFNSWGLAIIISRVWR